jgi:hypothetical protein
MSKEKALFLAGLCMVGLAVIASQQAKGQVVAVDPVPGRTVTYMGTVTALREVPAGNPLPGLHLELKADSSKVDVYIAPMDFINKYDLRFKTGDRVRILGTPVKSGATNVVLAREVGTGLSDTVTGKFREQCAYYLRNDAGPLWAEPRAAEPVAAH